MLHHSALSFALLLHQHCCFLVLFLFVLSVALFWFVVAWCLTLFVLLSIFASLALCCIETLTLLHHDASSFFALHAAHSFFSTGFLFLQCSAFGFCVASNCSFFLQCRALCFFIVSCCSFFLQHCAISFCSTVLCALCSLLFAAWAFLFKQCSAFLHCITNHSFCGTGLCVFVVHCMVLCFCSTVLFLFAAWHSVVCIVSCCSFFLQHHRLFVFARQLFLFLHCITPPFFLWCRALCFLHQIALLFSFCSTVLYLIALCFVLHCAALSFYSMGFLFCNAVLFVLPLFLFAVWGSVFLWHTGRLV